jgi:Uma2 family endonuclease
MMGSPTNIDQSLAVAEATTGWPLVEERLRRRLLEILLTPPEPPGMTYDEFLARADEDILAEWVKGQVILTSPASKLHQAVADFLLKVVGTFVEAHELGTVISAPFQMKLQSGRDPDLLFVANEHTDRFRESYLDGPADLVVEIVSPEGIGRDRGEKFYEYAQGGVPEYWLIDPQARWAEFYRLEEDHYRLAFGGREGEYHAGVLPGFLLRVEWLWQTPLPRVLDVLHELGVL